MDIKWLSGHSWHLTVLWYISGMLIFVSMHSVCQMRLSYFSQLPWNSRSSRGELHLQLWISGICAEQNNSKHWDQMFHLARICRGSQNGGCPHLCDRENQQRRCWDGNSNSARTVLVSVRANVTRGFLNLFCRRQNSRLLLYLQPNPFRACLSLLQLVKC